MRPPARTSRNAQTPAIATAAEKKKTRGTAVRFNGKLYYAIEEFADAIEALPAEVIRRMSMLNEVDAKCHVLQEASNGLIGQVLQMQDDVENPVDANEQLLRLRQYLTNLLPPSEEKIHIMNTAGEAVTKQLRRLDNCHKHIQGEIPSVVRLGPKNHPAYLAPIPVTRSETRREAVAAKRAERELPTVLASTTVPAPTPPKRKRATTDQNDDDVSSNYGGRAKNGGSSYEAATRVSERLPKPTTQRRARRAPTPLSEPELGDDDIFCICRGVSYGEMVACDGENCKYEWFHLPCVNLTAPPKGLWYCPNCRKQ
jgi:hypothetical protein